jgi:hypothetical protein
VSELRNHHRCRQKPMESSDLIHSVSSGEPNGTPELHAIEQISDNSAGQLNQTSRRQGIRVHHVRRPPHHPLQRSSNIIGMHAKVGAFSDAPETVNQGYHIPLR